MSGSHLIKESSSKALYPVQLGLASHNISPIAVSVVDNIHLKTLLYQKILPNE